MQSDLLLGDLGYQMYHFIHLTLRLFSENADVVDNTLGVLHNIAKNLENIRTHPEKRAGNPHFQSYYVTSGHIW